MKNLQLYLIIFLSNFLFTQSLNSAEIDIYKKIDLFGEVL
jgi:carboxyl-terminal processing protease